MLPVLFGENLFDDFFDDSFEREFRALNHNPEGPPVGKQRFNRMEE